MHTGFQFYILFHEQDNSSFNFKRSGFYLEQGAGIQALSRMANMLSLGTGCYESTVAGVSRFPYLKKGALESLVDASLRSECRYFEPCAVKQLSQEVANNPLLDKEDVDFCLIDLVSSEPRYQLFENRSGVLKVISAKDYASQYLSQLDSLTPEQEIKLNNSWSRLAWFEVIPKDIIKQVYPMLIN